MRFALFALILVSGSVASAEDDPPPPAPQPEPPPPAPAPPAPPAQTLPPIHINITNNNNGNNSNTSTQDNKQDNRQDNHQTNTQTSTQTNTQTNTQQLAPIAPIPEIAPPATVEPRGFVARYTPRLDRQRWVALGVLGGRDGKGVRASMDVLARRAWSLGLAASASGDHHHDARDGRDGNGGVVAYVAYTRKLGRRLSVRAQLGFGVGKGSDDRDEAVVARRNPAVTDEGGGGDDGCERPDVARRVEAALLFRLPLGKRQRFGLIGGPVLTGTRDRDDRDLDRDRRDRRGQVEKSFFTGLSYRF